MEPTQLATLDHMPVSIVVKEIQKTAAGIALKLVINSPLPEGEATASYGSKDALTLENRWASRLELGEKPPGEHTVLLPDAASAGACRVRLQRSFGSIWNCGAASPLR